MPTTDPSSPKSTTAVSRPRANSARPSWWWTAGLFLLGIPFLFLLWPAVDAEEEAQIARRRQIENMTASERERLEGNFDRFQELPEAKKAALRKIEHAVAEDKDLYSTLRQFDQWLNTLTPWERDALRKAETPEAKLQFVSQIVSAPERSV